MSEDERSVATGAGNAPGAAGTTRRALLRTAVNVGFATGLVWTAGTEYVTSESPGTITYAVARSEPSGASLEPRRKDVPPLWHESLRLAFAAQERIRDVGLDPLVDSFVVPGSYGEPMASLSVRATAETVVRQLEGLVDPVPVDVTLVDEAFLSPESDFDLAEAYRVRDLDPQAIPGGVLCKGGEIYGTLAPALYHRDRETPFFATSNHVVRGGAGDPDDGDVSLRLVHDGEADHVGDLARSHPVADLARVDPVDGYRPASAIERASPSRVAGQYTKFGLADLAARDEPLVKVGALSDRTSGQIQGVDGFTCYTNRACKTGQLRWGDSEALSDGDSGSVNFHPDPESPGEYVLVGGINNARTRWLADYTWGTAAHHLLAEYGLHF